MCGRFTHMYTWKEIHDLSTLTTRPMDLGRSFNVAPTQESPVVRAEESGRRLDLLRWGLVPSWAKELAIGNSLINARAETVATKPAFRAAFKSRRCLVPASGFFEWTKLEGGKRKQPFYIRLASEEPMFFAGLWEKWAPPEGEAVETYTIITTRPNALTEQYHDRMPVILDPSDFGTWLDPKAPTDSVAELLRPCPPELLMAYPVSTVVNSPKNNAPECVVPI